MNTDAPGHQCIRPDDKYMIILLMSGRMEFLQKLL